MTGQLGSPSSSNITLLCWRITRCNPRKNWPGARLPEAKTRWKARWSDRRSPLLYVVASWNSLSCISLLRSRELFFSCIKFNTGMAKVKTRKNWPVTRLPDAKTRWKRATLESAFVRRRRLKFFILYKSSPFERAIFLLYYYTLRAGLR